MTRPADQVRGAPNSVAPGSRQPDRGWVDGWLYRSYLNFWAR